jgi:hypothetical protein
MTGAIVHHDCGAEFESHAYRRRVEAAKMKLALAERETAGTTRSRSPSSAHSNRTRARGAGPHDDGPERLTERRGGSDPNRCDEDLRGEVVERTAFAAGDVFVITE